MPLTEEQERLLSFSRQQHIFLRGDAGSGKSYAALAWIRRLLEESTDARILVLAPQRAMLKPYEEALSMQAYNGGRQISLTTMGSLVRRMVTLFWPLISNTAGFRNPYKPPLFLTIETAQYYMGHLVEPMIAEGSFSSVTLQRHRLYSQLIDNLNKSALVGFPYTEIDSRLSAAWVGDPAQLNLYRDAQTAINAFRSFCLQNNLVDYSLQVALFTQQIWPNPACRGYMQGMFSDLVYDNCEEDPPYVHDCIAEWLPSFQTSLIIFDEHGSYRSFMGADPHSASSLARQADATLRFTQNLVSSAALQAVRAALIPPEAGQPSASLPSLSQLTEAIHIPPEPMRFFPQVLDYVVSEVQKLVENGTPAGQIAVLSPFVSSSLQFSLKKRLAELGIATGFIRPSVPLSDDPIVRCLLVLAQTAHPHWQLPPEKERVANCLTLVIDGLDPIRAHLLTQAVCADVPSDVCLQASYEIQPALQARLSPEILARFAALHGYLRTADAAEPFDLFISRLFGEILSQPGFQFHDNLQAGQSSAKLIESFRNFRWSFPADSNVVEDEMTREYINSVWDGVIAAQYPSPADAESEDAVLVAPVYSFLMHNQAVDYQFWLNVGSQAWYERLEQPLTHPYVLNSAWPAEKQWTAADEAARSEQTLENIIAGLISHCRKGIYLGISQYTESGMEERGLLLAKIQALYRRTVKAAEHD